MTVLGMLPVSHLPVLQSFGSPAVVGLAVLVLTVVVAAVALAKRFSDDASSGETDQTQPDRSTVAETTTGAETVTTGSTPAIDEATLSRLETVVPDAVDDVRNRSGGTEQFQPEERLSAAIDVAIDDGAMDMGHTSVYGRRYEIVNLPAHLRDIDLTQFPGQYHVREIDRQVREWLADESVTLRELSIALAELIEHRDRIKDHIRSRESEFERLVDEITANLDDITAIVDQIDGQVGDRFRQLVVENRHPEVIGVTAIRSDIDEAKDALHRCAFDKATRQLRDSRGDADTLLTAVDFFRSFLGGIDHGQQSANLPNEAAAQLCLQLTDPLERQYGVEIRRQGNQLIADGAAAESEAQRPHRDAAEETASGSTTEPADDIRSVQPEEITDEILYIFRDLRTQESSGNAIELQTEQLPDSVAQPSVLRELVSFCQRRSDIVDSVTLQEGAPPGFLELRFVETVTVDAGLETLADAFADRYASNS